MKKSLTTGHSLCIALICCMTIVSCGYKKKEMKTTNLVQHDAQIKTLENMQSAYKGEITATTKYAAYSKQAEKEGYHQIALLFDAVSAAERVHASNHKIVIEDGGATVPIIIPEFTTKTTKENLSEDIQDEAYEAKTMYPNFIKTALLADNQIAVLSLTFAKNTEKKHKRFFEETLAHLNAKTLDQLPTQYSVCPACGNTYSKAPKHCDFTLTERERFIVFQ